MFSMTIVFGSVSVPLLFKSRESFETAKGVYNTPALSDFNAKILDLTDDFGQHILIKRDSIHGAQFEDLEESKLAYIEKVLHQTRCQIAAQHAGQSDPSIRTATRPQGPAVISPFNGQFRQ